LVPQRRKVGGKTQKKYGGKNKSSRGQMEGKRRKELVHHQSWKKNRKKAEGERGGKKKSLMGAPAIERNS